MTLTETLYETVNVYQEDGSTVPVLLEIESELKQYMGIMGPTWGTVHRKVVAIDRKDIKIQHLKDDASDQLDYRIDEWEI